MANTTNIYGYLAFSFAIWAGCESTSHLSLSTIAQKQIQNSAQKVIEFDELVFADSAVEKQARYFHDLAKKTAEEDWFVEPFRDIRNSSNPRFVASWKTVNYRKSQFIKSVLPYRSITIVFNGPAKPEERLDTIEVYGTWIPKEGWAATVQYNSMAPFSATIGLVRQQDGQFSFDSVSGIPILRATQNFIAAQVDEKSLRYHYHSQLVLDLSPEANKKQRKRFLNILDSAETFRDTFIVDLGKLREAVTNDINQSKNVSVFDMSDVRSDNPPQEIPSPDLELTNETKQALLKRVTTQLDDQEKLLRENWKAMHVALKKAMPVDPEKLQSSARSR